MLKQEKIIILIMCVVYAIIGFTTETPSMSSLRLMGGLGLLQIVYSIMSWMKRGNQFVSPYVIFLIALYVFSFGQSFLWAFGLEPERSLIGYQGITISNVFYAQVLTLIMLASFHLGASSFLTTHKKHLNVTRISTTDYSGRLKQIGWFLFIVSIGPYITETISDMVLSLSKGYGALYEGEGAVGLDNWSGFLAGYFIPAVICLFIAYKDNSFSRNIFLSIILFNIVVILMTGGRTKAVILIAILVVLYNYLIVKFTKKWLILGVLGVFFLLQILAYIGEVRVERGRAAGLDGMKIETNAAVDALAEMGGSMFCLIKTMDLVPSTEPYRYGSSYAYSFTVLIPNFGFWPIHPAKKESNLSDWLTDALGLNHGTGFSMCAEAYANFGYFGIVVFFFWGWFIASVFGKIEISVRTQNYALLAFLLILFWYFLKLPRNNFINLVRPIFFVAGPIYLYCTKFKMLRK